VSCRRLSLFLHMPSHEPRQQRAPKSRKRRFTFGPRVTGLFFVRRVPRVRGVYPAHTAAIPRTQGRRAIRGPSRAALAQALESTPPPQPTTGPSVCHHVWRLPVTWAPPRPRATVGNVDALCRGRAGIRQLNYLSRGSASPELPALTGLTYFREVRCPEPCFWLGSETPRTAQAKLPHHVGPPLGGLPRATQSGHAKWPRRVLVVTVHSAAPPAGCKPRREPHFPFGGH
jgi:hypothetical protein